MIPIAEFVYPEIVSYDRLLQFAESDCHHLMFGTRKFGYKCGALDCKEDAAMFREWLIDAIKRIQEYHLFYAFIRVPVNYFGAPVLTDAAVTDYFGGDRRQIFGVHLTRGPLTEVDYLLRIYSLLRSGFTYFLAVDDLREHAGDYKRAIYNAAAAVWVDRPTKERVPVMQRTESLSSMIRLALSEKTQLAVLPYEYYLRRARWAKALSKFENLNFDARKYLRDSVTTLRRAIRTS